jgi:hypothetical protein
MLIITSVAALDAVTDETLRPILAQYRELMDLAVILIVQPGDTLDILRQARGRPFEGWEFIIDHYGWYEAVLIISDDGAGHVVLVPELPSIDPELLDLCRCHAVKAGDAETD